MPLATPPRSHYQYLYIEPKSAHDAISTRLTWCHDMSFDTLTHAWLYWIRKMLICAAIPAISSGSAAALTGCIPPIPPLLPESDRALVEYADLINKDFERYFADISTYSACLDQAHADLLAEAREVSRLHEVFLQRAASLGVSDKAVIEAP